MFPESSILNYLFWMAMGAMQVFVILGANAWLTSFNRKIAWWQLALMYGCFASLCTVIAGGFTLMGEYESIAGWYFIGFFGVIHVIVAAIMLKLFVLKKPVGTA